MTILKDIDVMQNSYIYVLLKSKCKNAKIKIHSDGSFKIKLKNDNIYSNLKFRN